MLKPIKKPIKIYLHWIYLSLLVVFSLQVTAQDNKPQPNTLDELYVPDKNSIFNSNSSSSSGPTNSALEIKNVIKFNPFLIIRGVAPLYYEYCISDAFSLQGGLGLTFQKDPIQISVISDTYFQSSIKSDLSFNEMVSQFDFIGDPTLFYALSLKLKIEEYYDYFTYFEFGMRGSAINLKLMGDSYNYDPYIEGGNPTINVKNISYCLIYGYQLNRELKKIFLVHDIFSGLGMKKISYDIFEYKESIYDSQYYYSKMNTRESIIVPTFFLGYSFGIGF